NALLAQAIEDVRMLCNRYETGIFPTAGMPWFAVPFGRDTLISSILLLHVNPDLARGVLRYRAAHQGTKVDEGTDEQPGKILHEVRDGEVVDRGLWPHILFGTVDATALFLCALTEAEDWTRDHGLSDELWPAAEAALAWCRRYGDLDGDGYIEYLGGRAHNQGWKDSDDSLTNSDGSVWPFDSALAVAGLRQYGCAVEAERVARGVIQAAITFPMRRPPELFCGDARTPTEGPKKYWNTCTPQLWSAAAMFTCVSEILGLEADPRRKSLRVAPIETPLWNRIEVSGLHFAG